MILKEKSIDQLVNEFIYHNSSKFDATQECHDIEMEVLRRNISNNEFSMRVFEQRKNNADIPI